MNTRQLKINLAVLLMLPLATGLAGSSGLNTYDGSHSSTLPTADLGTAILDGNWNEIQALAAKGAQTSGAKRDTAVLRGYAALARGETPEATQHFLRSRTVDPNQPESGWFLALAKAHPDNAIAQFLAGDERARAGDVDAGLDRLDTALRLDPQLSVARLAKALLQAMKGDSVIALQELDALIGDDTVGVDALAARGLIKLSNGELDAALADLNHTLELEPDHAVAHNARGIAYAHSAEWARAAQEFQVAFVLMPELIQARQNWQIAQRATSSPGSLIAEKRQQGSITIADGINRDDMMMATARATDELWQQTGRMPVVVRDLQAANRLASSQDVILQRPHAAFGATDGQVMQRVFEKLNARTPVNFVVVGHDAAYNASQAISRYLNDTPKDRQVLIKSLNVFDPGDLARSSVGMEKVSGATIRTEPFLGLGPKSEAFGGLAHLEAFKYLADGDAIKSRDRQKAVTEIRAPRQVVEDRILRPFPYLQSVELMDTVTGLAGAVAGGKAAATAGKMGQGDTPTPGVLDTRTVGDYRYSFLSGALRWRSFSDGTYGLYKFSPQVGRDDQPVSSDPLHGANWRLLSTDEAVDVIHRRAAYQTQVNRGPDKDFARLFSSLTSYDWQPSFAKMTSQDPSFSSLLKLDRQNELPTLKMPYAEVHTTVGAFLKGDIPQNKKELALAGEYELSRQFRGAYGQDVGFREWMNGGSTGAGSGRNPSWSLSSLANQLDSLGSKGVSVSVYAPENRSDPGAMYDVQRLREVPHLQVVPTPLSDFAKPRSGRNPALLQAKGGSGSTTGLGGQWDQWGADSFEKTRVGDVWHQSVGREPNVPRVAEDAWNQAQRTGASDAVLIFSESGRADALRIASQLQTKGFRVHLVADERMSPATVVGSSMGWAMNNKNRSVISLTIDGSRIGPGTDPQARSVAGGIGNSPTAPGGVLVGPVNFTRGEGGRVVFGSGSGDEGKLQLVYPVFGFTEATK